MKLAKEEKLALLARIQLGETCYPAGGSVDPPWRAITLDRVSILGVEVGTHIRTPSGVEAKWDSSDAGAYFRDLRPQEWFVALKMDDGALLAGSWDLLLPIWLEGKESGGIYYDFNA